MEPAKLPSLISLVRDRPVKLAGAIALTLATVALVDGLADTAALGWLRDLISKSDVFGPLFFPDSGTIEWKDRLQGIVLLLGLPVAFLLWYWRDRNVRDQIEEQRRQVENARKDTNLKEFQDVKLHVAGVFDESVPAKAQEQLQIAALHQLRPFLRGEYGADFRRPAFELLLAGHAAAMDEIGTRAACAEFENGADNKNGKTLSYRLEQLKSKLNLVMKERISIFELEAEAIFGSGFRLSDRNFDFLRFKLPEYVNEINFMRSSFIKSNLRGSNLSQSSFHSSYCVCADFSDCKLLQAGFYKSTLTETDFSRSQISGAGFGGSNWQQANFTGAVYSSYTSLDNLSFYTYNDPFFSKLRALGAFDQA